MAIYLFIEKGPKKGEKFEISGGEIIGRDKGDIILSDAKVSGTHALVKKALMGGDFILVDQKSKNGVILNGERVDKIRLKPGISFRIGKNHFKVLSEKETASMNTEALEDSTKDSFDDPISSMNTASKIEIEDETFEYEPGAEPLLEEDTSHLAYDPNTEATSRLLPPEQENVPLEEEPITAITRKFEDSDLSGLSIGQLTNDFPTKPTNSNQNVSVRTLETSREDKAEETPEGKKTWSEVLEEFSRSQLKLVKDHPSELKPLTPRVRLTFFRGPQTETEWELGYGPRNAGRSSLDLPILDQGAPKERDLFKILPSEQGPLFATNCLDIVSLNGKPQSDVVLKSGDIISILETEIEVNLF
jgi:hypothetical protein